MKTRIARARGVALLIVLLVVALVAIVGTEMVARLQLQAQRTANIKDSNQAYWYALGAEQYARKSIELLFEQSNDKIHLDQPWSQEFIYPLDNGGIKAQLVDLQSCFNLNSLRTNSQSNNTNNREQVTATMEAFHRLMLTRDLLPELDSFTADTVRDSLADWLDEDDSLRSYGAEDIDYESLPNPYLAANTLMLNKTELRMVNGVSPEWINELLPYVCAIPNDARMKINVNTLTEELAPVLAAVTSLDTEQAARLIAGRPADGYDDVATFLAEPDITALELDEERSQWFSVTTQYFILYTKTRYNNATFSMSSVFFVGDDNKVSVVRREFGGRY
ncbi:type II secretion system minor pseudopilin GspK [Alteromonas sp. ASW11-36]|uniref:Type II secretion system protein K n=1 Tax=Alteromonas arenosi TaxID=3055817 RepID=A0ABT7T0V6_9ALTE|nr:type II secretion system minor pseudopilin GspK [Alteromonas sp. ASW11-36]MDM7862075.1 type II secretion system minor pseudopilin GspK [Alteromonas sp. ASW11-36]